MFDSDKHLFVLAKGKWKNYLEKDYRLPEDGPETVELEGGIMLPLRARQDVKVAYEAYEGGVCDRDGNFVAGHFRRVGENDTNLSCTRAYALPETLLERHETVVFGGMLYYHHGDNWNEFFPERLWWLADHPDTTYKFVFFEVPWNRHHGGFKYYSQLEDIGIPQERMEIITEPTRFDRVIVPCASVINFSGFRPQMLRFFDYVRSCAKPSPCKKVYLSRTRFVEHDMVNEEYFEEFYRKRGYEIVYPEQLPFLEQVSLMAGAEEVACTYGTITANTYFCRPNTKVTVLMRCRGLPGWSQMMRCLARELDLYFIQTCLDFLPTTMFPASIYFVGPTVYWQKYLDTAGIPYEPEEMSFELHIQPHIYDYLTRWAKHYSNPGRYRGIKNATLIEVVNRMNCIFFDKAIDMKSLPERDDVVQLRADEAGMRTQIESLQTYIAALSERNEALTAQNKDVRQDNGDLRQANAALLLQNEDVRQDNGDLRQVNEDLRLRCDELHGYSDDLREQNEVLAAQLNEAERRLSDTRSEMKLVRKDNSSQKKENAKLKKQLQWMQNTRSWRVTKPLRAITRSFRSLFGKA